MGLAATMIAIPSIAAALGDGRETWLVLLAAWNSALVLWAAALAAIRRRQNPRRAWPWLWPTAFALVAAAWLWPVGWSIGLVYLHPLLALTAFTYPIVICVLPPLVWAPWGRGWYLLVAETFAPVAECLLFRAAFGPAPTRAAACTDVPRRG